MRNSTVRKARSRNGPEQIPLIGTKSNFPCNVGGGWFATMLLPPFRIVLMLVVLALAAPARAKPASVSDKDIVDAYTT